MAGVIEQTGQDVFEMTSRGNQMMLVRKADHWEMWTRNASTQAWNNGLPSMKVFGSLAEVESTYKTWKGIGQLIEDTGKGSEHEAFVG